MKKCSNIFGDIWFSIFYTFKSFRMFDSPGVSIPLRASTLALASNKHRTTAGDAMVATPRALVSPRFWRQRSEVKVAIRWERDQHPH